MGHRSRQWICFCLFRLLLPLVQLAAAIVRFSGFSLLYGCLALLTPLFRRPTRHSIRGHTGWYLIIALVLCCLTMLSQASFQLFVVFAEPNVYNTSILAPCTSLESTLRQIGLQAVNADDPWNAVRIILPDVGVFAVTLLVFVCCRLLLRAECVPSQSDDSNLAPNRRGAANPAVAPERRRLFKYGIMIADFAGNFMVVMTMGACGIALPSALNSVYFVMFILVVTLWSCCFRLSRWFSIISLLLLVFVAGHLIVIHLSQFEFMQYVWHEQANGNKSLIERIIGVPRFVKVDCNQPWAVIMLENIKWTEFLDVALLLFFYFILAFEIRRRIAPASQAALPSTTQVAEQYVNPAAVQPEMEGHAYDAPNPNSERQGLIEGPAAVPNYHSLDPVDDEAGPSELPDLAGDDSARENTCRRDSRSDTSSKGVAAILFQLMADQSYIGTLIIMMAWSVVYHSWLTFVLLISACLIWIFPKKRVLCFRCSPLIVFYAVCLIILQYIYGFDLNNDELPDTVSGYQLQEIGLVKYKYPIGPLAVQIGFTLIFWLTMRQFMWECTTRRRTSHLEAESLETLSEADGTRRVHVDPTSVRWLKIFGEWLHSMFCKYWIFVCSALFLLLALQDPNVYRIIYMILFLLFIISFQLNYSVWRLCINVFWWVVIIYSMIVLCWIYVFQFEDILSKWQNITGMSDSQVADLGLERFDTSQLLVHLLTPTSFIIFIILHLHYFQKTFLHISDINRYRDGQTLTDDLVPEAGTQQAVLQGPMQTVCQRIETCYNYITVLLWRLSEIHFHKVVMLVIFVHCTKEVCAINIVFVVILVILMPFKTCYKVMSHICQFYASVIIVIKMVYQLHWVPSDAFTSNCTTMRNGDHSSGIPYPFNSTIDSAAYVGFIKVDNLSVYIQDYVVIVLLLAFEAIIRVHQTQYYYHPNHVRPPSGIVFVGISRADADVDLLHCAKFLVNYAFYKFGKEICFIMTIITMVIRLDMYSVIYGVFLGALVLLSRRCCFRLWTTYIIVLMTLLIVQYLSCVGAPLALCWEYPWNLFFKNNITYENLKIFLFLPNYMHTSPFAYKLVADFFQLLFVCLQWHVFTSEKTDDCDDDGGCNRSVIPSLCSNNTQNPRGDFMTYKQSYLDYIKVVVFYFSFWVTLLVVFITGTSRISLFCLGYLIGSFLILWFGQDLLLKPTRALLRTWSVFMMYSYVVVMVKCCLQLVGCVYLQNVPCTVRQLFSITCIQSMSYDMPDTGKENNSCPLDKDDAGLAWDAVSFTFLLLMTRVYKTWYFQHVVTDLYVDSKLSSRGGEIINESLLTRVKQRKAHEEFIVNKIKRKMERIRLRHYRLGHGAETEPTDHYVVIRSGDYYMFDDLSDDELEVQTEVSDEAAEQMVFDEDLRKPGPLQIINAGITSGAKGALNLWRHQSMSSPESPEQEEKTGDGDTTATAEDDNQSLDLPAYDPVNAEKLSGKPEKPAASGEGDLVPVPLDQESTTEPKEPVVTGVANIFMVIWVIIVAFLENVIIFLNHLSSEYRKVSQVLGRDKERAKAHRRACDASALQESGHSSHSSHERTPPVRPSSISLRTEEDQQKEQGGQADQQFESQMPLPLRLIKAIFDVLLSHSELLCYFAMVLNAMVTGSLCSVVYPVLAFLWAMLSSPRPSKAFWVFAITYTEVLIVIKYLFQFSFYDWNKPDNSKRHYDLDGVFSPLYIFGIEKKDAYAAFDLFLLFSLFIHRSILKQHGLWKDAGDTFDDLRKAENVVASRQNTPAVTPKDVTKMAVVSIGGDSDSRDDMVCDVIVTDSVNNDDDGGGDGVCESPSKSSTSCCNGFTKLLGDFYDQMRNPKFSAATDVYAFMFTCDLITFIIVVFGYASFGPSEAGNAEEMVTSVIKQNRVPAPFLGMLLAQFILIIIDRALYLRKQIFGKFIFQIFLVFLVHAWMFFGLPAITSKRFTKNTVAQLWYFTKCVYFALSAYQIRCGYPTRILGNFLTKKYNYLNLFCFKGFLVIPFLLELRALMDWMFTDTTLALTSWLQMEDIFSNVFCIKCDRHAERVFTVQRGQKRRAIVKYGLGGLLLFILIFIIWFPLLLFSLSETIFVPDPPVDVTVNIKIWGYQTLFTMSAQQQWLTQYNEKDYQELWDKLKENKGQAYLNMYHKEDIYKSDIDGTSGSTWDISPPNIQRLQNELESDRNVSIYVTVSFTREPSPGLKTETVTGLFVRTLFRHIKEDNETMYNISRMLYSENQTVRINRLYPHYWTVPASGKASEATELNQLNDYMGNVSLQLNKDVNSSARWWTLKDVNGTVISTKLTITSFNQRIAPTSVLSMATSYGVIGLYVSLVLVIGQFVRMWVQGLSFRIMFVELPNPDILVKLCLDIYMVREWGELSLEEELFSQLIFLYRSPETLIKVTRRKIKAD